ncbi:hypothetical protein CHH55_23510 [Niallia circulans]|uniref:hypothetical protein n=1 Tax=Niallia circulans TaxID=1397 RepID=UPI000BA548DE|nr:hypothetical protein [Niallia circulans]PAD85435.1 hypothetical protein CHH55_23510 [Niallia circulans]
MTINSKQLSNPSSTGGLGIHFENRVQASFVLMMLTGGFAPCLSPWPIKEIKFQGKYQDFETDDVIIYIEQLESGRKAKLLGQIKHTIKITMRDKVFGEVIQAAWTDFNNKGLFEESTDAIALITGPLSAIDTIHVRALLQQAKYSSDSNDFIQRVKLGNFTSKEQREKLEVFKEHLKIANNNVDLTNDELWRFLKSYNLLIFDLDIKGITLSLMHSIIGYYSQESIEEMLALIEKEITYISENAGSVTNKTIPDRILSLFQSPTIKTIPTNLYNKNIYSTSLNESEFANEITIINLIGSWNDKYHADLELIEQISKQDLNVWNSKVREILQSPEIPLSIKNSIWTIDIDSREELWNVLGGRIFDDTLELFSKCAEKVLTEIDPKFELGVDQRFAANIYGKKMKYSHSIRRGLAESLAILGNINTDLFSNCSNDKVVNIIRTTIYNIFNKSNWLIWGSLSELLPFLAEAAPDEFLNAIEKALNQKPCPFDELFNQEGSPIFGETYISGIQRGLEVLAWEERYLVRVTAILGELASRDPGGNWANRPLNSLSSIFLPWYPQTKASVEKRRVAVKTLLEVTENKGWELLINLLPNKKTISSGTYKPKWRKIILDEKVEKITKEEYNKQILIYAEMTVDIAVHDQNKIIELIRDIHYLPISQIERIIDYLVSNIAILPESERINIWSELIVLISRHKYFSDAAWALNTEILKKIESTVYLLEPKNPLNLYRILFNKQGYNLFKEKGEYEKQRETLDSKRENAIRKILDYGGISSVLKFAKTVDFPNRVGFLLGKIGDESIDSLLLPNFLSREDNIDKYVISGYVLGRFSLKGWDWVDIIKYESWDHTQLGDFYTYLPFTNETWKRVIRQLEKQEYIYWNKTNVDPYQLSYEELKIAIEKLLYYKRPHAAIECIIYLLQNKPSFDVKIIIDSLIAGVTSEESISEMNSNNIVELIDFLQSNSEVDSDVLAQIEWAYLQLLDNFNKDPQGLERKMSTDAEFFCKLIRYAYRSEKESENSNEKDLGEVEKNQAENAYRLINKWRKVPGVREDGSFSEEHFQLWFETVKKECSKTGHLDVALLKIGKVLFYSPSDPSELWIHRKIASIINNRSSEIIREGYITEAYNSRGVYSADPSGKSEMELSERYKNLAELIENNGFHRFAISLRSISESYERQSRKEIGYH